MRRKIFGLILLLPAFYYCAEDKTPKVWELTGWVWVIEGHERDTVEHPRNCFIKRYLDEVDVENSWACDPPPKSADEAIKLRGSF